MKVEEILQRGPGEMGVIEPAVGAHFVCPVGKFAIWVNMEVKPAQVRDRLCLCLLGAGPARRHAPQTYQYSGGNARMYWRVGARCALWTHGVQVKGSDLRTLPAILQGSVAPSNQQPVDQEHQQPVDVLGEAQRLQAAMVVDRLDPPVDTLAELQGRRLMAAAPLPQPPDPLELEAQLPLQSIRQRLRFSSLDVSVCEQTSSASTAAVTNGSSININSVNASSKTASCATASRLDRMKVYLRVRPLTEAELAAGEEKRCFQVDGPRSIVTNAPGPKAAGQRDSENTSHRFTFTRVFNESVSQAQMYEDTVSDLVMQLIEGHSGLVFSYGVTSAGKTHTIQGSSDQPGILPRALNSLFANIGGRLLPHSRQAPLLRPTSFLQAEPLDQRNAQAAFRETEQLIKSDETGESLAAAWFHNSRSSNFASRRNSGCGQSYGSVSADPDNAPTNSAEYRFCVWVSYAEIYNEVVYDLLEPIGQRGRRPSRTALEIRSDRSGSFYIRDLRCLPVRNAKEACRLVLLGKQNQQVAATKLNQQSSRSHSLFAIRLVTSMDRDSPNVGVVSSLTFCDLAGSERQRSTGGHSAAAPGCGDRVREAGSINSSLLTLRRCIETLQHNQQNPKTARLVPFRESKLTRLIQPYFSGSGRATMIVNISRCASLYDETFNVLRFSALASNIVVTAPTPQRLHLAAPNAASPGYGVKNIAIGSTRLATKTTRPATTNTEANNAGSSVPSTAPVVTNEVIDIIDLTVEENDEQAGDDNEAGQESITEQQYEVTYVDEDEFEMADIAQLNNEQLLKLIASLRQSARQLEEDFEERELRIRRELIAERDRRMNEMEERFEQQMQEQKELLEDRHDARLREYLSTSSRISDNREKRLNEAHEEKIKSLRERIATLEDSLGEARSEQANLEEQVAHLDMERENLQMQLELANRQLLEQSATIKQTVDSELNIRVKRIGEMQRRLAESAIVAADISMVRQPLPRLAMTNAMRATLGPNDSFLRHEVEAELIEEQENRQREVGAMTASLACSQEMMDCLRNERDALSSELEAATNHIEQLEQQIEELQQHNRGVDCRMTIDYSPARRDSNNSNGNQSDRSCSDESFVTDTVKKAAKKDDFREKLDMLEEQLAAALTASVAKDEQVASLKQQLLTYSSEAEAQLQQLAQQLAIETSASKAKDKQLSILAEQKREADAQNELLKQQHSNELGALKACEQQLNELQLKLQSQAPSAAQNSKCWQLTEQLREARRSLMSATAESALKDNQIADLHEMLIHRMADAEEQAEKFKQLNEEVTNLTEQLQQAELSLQSAAAESAAKDLQLTDLRQRLDEAAGDAQGQIDELNQQLTDLKQQLECQQSAQNEALAENLKKQNEQLQQAEQSLQSAATESAAKDIQLTELRQQLDKAASEAEERLEKLRQQLYSTSAALEASEQQLTDLRQEFETRVSVETAQTEAVKELSEQLQQAELSLQSAAAESAAKDLQLTDLRQRLDEAAGDAQGQIDELNQQLTDLKQQLECQQSAQNEALAENLKKQNEQLQQAEQSLQSSATESAAKDIQLTELRQQLDKAASEAEERLEKLQNQFESQLASLESQTDDLGGSNEQLSTQLDKAKEYICDLEARLSVQLADNEAKTIQLTELNSKLDDSRTEFTNQIQTLEQQLAVELANSLAKDDEFAIVKQQLTHEKAKADELIGTMKQQLEMAVDNGVPVWEKNKDLVQLNKELSDGMQELNLRIQQSEQQNAELTAKLREELDRVKNQLTAEQARLEARDGSLAAMRAEICETKDNYEKEMQHVKNQLTAEQARLEARDGSLAAMRAEICETKDNYEKEMQHLREQLEIEVAESVIKDEMLIELKQTQSSDLAQSQQKLKELKEELEKLAADCRAKEAKVEELTQQLVLRGAKAKQDLLSSEHRAAAAEAAAEIAKRDCQDWRQRMQRLQVDLNDETRAHAQRLEEARAEHRRQVEALKSDLAKQRDKAQHELDAEMAKVADLQLAKTQLIDQLAEARVQQQQLPLRQSTMNTNTSRQSSKSQKRPAARMTLASVFSSEDDDDPDDDENDNDNDVADENDDAFSSSSSRRGARAAATRARGRVAKKSVSTLPAAGSAKRRRKSVFSSKSRSSRPRRTRAKAAGAAAASAASQFQTPVTHSAMVGPAGSTRNLRSRRNTGTDGSVPSSAVHSPTNPLKSATLQQPPPQLCATEPKRTYRLYTASTNFDSPLIDPVEGETPPPLQPGGLLLPPPTIDPSYLRSVGRGARGGRGRKPKK